MNRNSAGLEAVVDQPPTSTSSKRPEHGMFLQSALQSRLPTTVVPRPESTSGRSWVWSISISSQNCFFFAHIGEGVRTIWLGW